jgi:outer membrane protein OmpA-like peptidoglycan-associated protein
VSCWFIGFFFLTVQADAQRFDDDSLWNRQPPSDTVHRSLFTSSQFGGMYHLASGLECLEGGRCTPFEGGLGSLYGQSVGAEQQIMPYWLASASLSVYSWNGMMQVKDGSARVRMPDGSITNIERELTMETRGTSLALGVGMTYFRDAWRLSASPVMEMFVGDPVWTQSGRILSPAGVNYPNGSTSTVIVPEVAIPTTTAVRFGLAASVGRDVQLSGGLTLTPSVMVQYTPTSFVTGASWNDVRWMGSIAVRMNADDLPDTVIRIRTYRKIDTIFVTRQGATNSSVLEFGPIRIKADTTIVELIRQITITEERTDTLVTFDPLLESKQAIAKRIEDLKLEESKRLIAIITLGDKSLPLKTRRVQPSIDSALGTSIDLLGTSDGMADLMKRIAEDEDSILNRKVADDLAIRLATERQELTFMILPFIFFDSASAAIPRRYRQLSSTEGYDPARDVSGQHELNLDILNIMGARIDTSKASIIIRGFADETSEGASCELARARAQTVVDYLKNVWRIPPERLRLEVAQGSCSPNPASGGNSVRGRQENRRVEIFSEDNQFFQPVQKVNVIVRPSWDMSQARVNIVNETDPVSTWETSFIQGSRLIASTKGEGPVNETALSIPDRLLDSLTDQPIIVVLNVRSIGGLEWETMIEIAVDAFQKDIKYENLSLAMFAVRSTELGARDLELLKDFAAPLDSGDRVAVIGYSDDLGNPLRNQQLSLRRAEVVADRLRTLRPDCVITRVEGIASMRFPIGVTSYELPEQRFMSRTVQLMVER